MKHDENKKEGWKEYKDSIDLTGINENQLSILKSAFEYGWYCAYGLVSEDKRHDEIVAQFKKLEEKL